MSDKPYHQMTDAELALAGCEWAARVEGAGGWSSAYFSAKQVEAICAIANRRGLGFVNPYPIKRG
jgi:hypothetical protein